ncbi:MAG TPA: integration host factor subunit beta [Planctomycetaceae bacterium]|nr:integration host factor subunit beta [Planctomycetaceae bacterium]
MTKTKKEIVKTISDQTGLTQLKTKEIVQMVFDAIVDALVEHKRIELRNFGVFEVKKRAARRARNPRTGERVDVAEKYVVTFKPGKRMEERVRTLEQADLSATAETAPPATPSPSAPGLASASAEPSVPTHEPPVVAGSEPGATAPQSTPRMDNPTYAAGTPEG